MIGSIGMAIMSVSLLLFGIALGKITNATKGVSFKQVGVIASLTVLLGGSVALLGFLLPTIVLGSISVAIMGVALIPFGIALNKISKATKNIKLKDILSIVKSMVPIGLTISAMSILTGPILLGSFAVKTMVNVLSRYITALERIKKLGEFPTKIVHQALNSLKEIANFFKKNSLNLRAIIAARRYKRMLKPFGRTLYHLGKLKDLGIIPMKLVHQTLNAMSIITDFYKQQEFGFFESIRLRHTSSLISGFISNFAEAVESFKSLSDSKSIPLNEINNIINSINNISNMDPTNISSVGSAISSAISGVESVDISKVQAVTNMFNAFNGINKSENAINKFTESVKEFTTTCKNLIDAMGDNTNAINNIDGISVNNEYSTKEILDNNISENSSNGNGNVSKSGIQILNVEEIAKSVLVLQGLNGKNYPNYVVAVLNCPTDLVNKLHSEQLSL